MTDKFKQYIEESERILITSHTSPDPDAVSSVLLLGTTLQLNFPEKKIQMVLEEEPEGLEFLDKYEEIKFQPLIEATPELKPDLFVMVDVGNFERASRKDGKQLGEYVTKNEVKTVTIDHHEPAGRDEVDLYINNAYPAAAQEVYELCFRQMGLKKPPGYAQTTMLGLYADTGGFIYANPHYKQSFELVSELVEAGADIESIKNLLNQYSEDQMKVIGELTTHISHADNYTYAYITDQFMADWLKAGESIASLHVARKKFIDDYIRSVDGRQWGFVISPDPLDGQGWYSVSLRSTKEARDVSQIARRLDGGGHKSSAGGKVQAPNAEEALEKVKAAIAQTD